MIVVAGGGLAALEFVLALRAHTDAPVSVVAPDAELIVRPMLVAEPLRAAPAHHYALDALAAEIGFELVPASVAAVDGHTAFLRGGGTLDFDTLVLAPGARRVSAFEDAIHLGDAVGTRGLNALRLAVESGAVRSVVCVAPTLAGWLLPLYEAALLLAGLGAEVSLVTAERHPLEVFGGVDSERVAAALDAAGVRFYGERRRLVEADRTISLPLLRGPRIAGVPATGLYGMIPVDGYGRVDGLRDVYAIGDATDFPIKQGALACQQADVAAAQVAGVGGAPFTAHLYATLLTGADPIVLGDGPPGKVPGQHLAPFLAMRE